VVWFLVSLGLHGGAGMWVKVRSAAVEQRPAVRSDIWSGRGIEIDPAEVEVAPSSASSPSDPTSATAESAGASDSPAQAVALEPLCVANCAPAMKAPIPVEAKPIATTKPKPLATTSATGIASSGDSTAAAPSSSVATSGGTTSGDAFGAVGLPPGVRYLPKAYTRALPQGSWGLAGFRTAPTGKFCEAHVVIAVAEDKTLGALEVPDELERASLPALCKTMFENAHRLVSNGEFSLDPKTLTSGVMRLRIEVVVSDVEALPEGDPQLWNYDDPLPGKRGRGTFVLPSGRRVDAFVNIE
jgi:hypothetical protein